MAMNRIQFQPGLSLPAFLQQFGTEAQCAATLEQARWPHGFRCPRCDQADHYVLHGGTCKTFQCQTCRLQTSLIAGTVFQSTDLALTVRFLAIYLISQAKTDLSALALKRRLGPRFTPKSRRFQPNRPSRGSHAERRAAEILQGFPGLSLVPNWVHPIVFGGGA